MNTICINNLIKDPKKALPVYPELVEGLAVQRFFNASFSRVISKYIVREGK